MTTGHHTDDDFSFHAREIARQRGLNPDSLNKRAKLTVGEPTISNVPVHHFGKHTLDAIANSLNHGVEYSSDAIGPSDYYLRTGAIAFGPSNPPPRGQMAAWKIGDSGAGSGFTGVGAGMAHDLLYRPNDHLRLETMGKASPQVGGNHYGDPATDVYAFSMANGLDPMQFNIVKYVTRFRKKDGLKDLQKAKQTIERLIAYEEAKK